MTTPATINKADPTTLPVASAAIQVCPSLGPGQTVIVYNNDLTNVAYVGYRTSGLTPSNTVPIQPLASATLDASRVMYGFCPTATVNLTVAPAGTNIQPSPAQIAAQIQALGLATSANQTSQLGLATTLNSTVSTAGNQTTQITQLSSTPSTTIATDISNQGTPLLHGYNTVAGPGSQAIAAGVSATLATITFSKPGYVIKLSPTYTSTNGTAPLLEIQMTWQDASGNNLAQETWYTWIGASGFINAPMYGKGPTKAPKLVVKFTNLDPAQSITVQYEILESTHHISRDDWRSGQMLNIGAGYSIITNDGAANIVAGQLGFNIPATSTVAYALPLYAGQVQYTYSAAVAGAIDVQLRLPTQQPIVGASVIWIDNLLPAGQISHQFNIPRCPIVATFINHNAAAIAVNFAAIAQEYAS